MNNIPALQVTSGLCPSGIKGFDDILAGGLPQNCFYLVQGIRVLERPRWRFSFCSKVYGSARATRPAEALKLGFPIGLSNVLHVSIGATVARISV